MAEGALFSALLGFSTVQFKSNYHIVCFFVLGDSGFNCGEGAARSLFSFYIFINFGSFHILYQTREVISPKPLGIKNRCSKADL